MQIYISIKALNDMTFSSYYWVRFLFLRYNVIADHLFSKFEKVNEKYYHYISIIRAATFLLEKFFQKRGNIDYLLLIKTGDIE